MPPESASLITIVEHNSFQSIAHEQGYRLIGHFPFRGRQGCRICHPKVALNLHFADMVCENIHRSCIQKSAVACLGTAITSQFLPYKRRKVRRCAVGSFTFSKRSSDRDRLAWTAGCKSRFGCSSALLVKSPLFFFSR